MRARATATIRKVSFTRRRAQVRSWSPCSENSCQAVEEYRAKIASLDQPARSKGGRARYDCGDDRKAQKPTSPSSSNGSISGKPRRQGAGITITYLGNAQQLTENQKDTAIQKSRLAEANAAVAAIIEPAPRPKPSFIASLFSDSRKRNARLRASASDLEKAEERTKRQLLTAPVDGVVQQLAVHTVGGVVTPAQQLAVVVPSDAVLEVEAKVSNRDIGFVHVGQDAQIKVDTFNFTRYGLLQGES